MARPSKQRQRQADVDAMWGGDRVPLVILAILAGLVFLMGGSARGDVASLVVLRPIAALIGGWALWQLWGVPKDTLRIPLGFFLMLAGIMALQLVPLPAGWWQSLPNRDVIAAIDAAVGLGDVARPLSMAPSATTNALAALVVPIAGILVAASLPGFRRADRLFLALFMMSFVSAVWSIGQIAGGEGNALYTYRITNDGWPVGAFANRNHAGVFLALSIIWFAYLFPRLSNFREPNATFWKIALPFALFINMIVWLLNGSRAALIAGALASAIGIFIYFRSKQSLPHRVKNRKPRIAVPMPVLVAICALPLVAMAGLFAFAGRLPGLERLGDTGIEELRGQLLTVLSDMATQYLPVGAGFGTFEHVYRLGEPADLLRNRYLNQAHNDWLQWIIEGGLPIIVLGAALLVWLGLRLIKALKSKGGDWAAAVAALATLALIGVASLVDYPLRTPIMSLTAAWMLLLVAQAGRDRALAFHPTEPGGVPGDLSGDTEER